MEDQSVLFTSHRNRTDAKNSKMAVARQFKANQWSISNFEHASIQLS